MQSPQKHIHRRPGKRPARRAAKHLCCLAACLLAAVLFCGWQAGRGAGREQPPPAGPEPDASIPAAIDLTRPEGGQLDLAYLTGQQSGPPAAAPAGDTMTEAELLDTAKELLARGQALYEYIWFPGGWALDAAAPLEEEWNGAPRRLYPLLDLADEAQLRAVYTSIFSTDTLRREEQQQYERMEYYPGTEYGRFPFVEREGRLYADPAAFFALNITRLAPDTLRLVGASADAAVLEARYLYQGVVSGEGMSITLLRENGRWVLAGTLWDMPLDNHFVPLPQELAALAGDWEAQDPDAAFCLRQAARLGQALAAGDAEEVNRCFIDRGGAAPPYDLGEYPLADLTGLQVSGCRVEPAGPLPQGEDADGEFAPLPEIWLWLDIADPGVTPLRAGSERYLLRFHSGGDSSFARGCVAALQPESELQPVDDALREEFSRQLGMLRWYTGAEEFADFPQEEPFRLLNYLHNIAWPEGAEASAGFTWQQLEEAGKEQLGLDVLPFGPELLAQEGYYQQDGLWQLPERCGPGGIGPAPVRRVTGLAREGDTITAALRFYADALCLVPDYDLIYTFHVSPAGVWQPVSCVKQAAA